MITFSAFRLHFGVLGSSFGFVLRSFRSFWVPLAAEIQTPSHQANIAKTYENHLFLLILAGWRLDNAHVGSFGELLAWLLAAWMAAGWLVDGLAGAGWLTGRP